MMEESQQSVGVDVTAGSSRFVNWTSEEKIILCEEIKRKEELLYGKFNGCSRTAAKRKAAWEDVLQAVNAIGKGSRTVFQIKKKYLNIKQSAKQRISSTKRPPTGGGPPLKPADAAEQFIVENQGGRPGMSGIDGGLDSEAATVVEDVASCSFSPWLALNPILCSSNVSTAEVEQPSTSQPAQSTAQAPILFQPLSQQLIPQAEPMKSKSKNVEDSILIEELSKIKDQRNLIEQKMILVKLQQKLTIFQIKTLDPEFEE